MQTPEQPSDQKRHIRQALADLVFGLALFVLFVLLGVFGVKQAASDETTWREGVTQARTIAQPQEKDNGAFLQEPVSPGALR